MPPNTTTWMQYLRSIPNKWQRRSRIEKRLLLEAFVLLGVARLLVLCVPFRWLAKSLGEHMRESAQEATSTEAELAELVGEAVRSAANNTPWESVCLPQAVAGQWMLKRRRIAATLYLGVMKAADSPQQLTAHAWLRCGSRVLTGAAGHQRFTVVSMFS